MPPKKVNNTSRQRTASKAASKQVVPARRPVVKRSREEDRDAAENAGEDLLKAKIDTAVIPEDEEDDEEFEIDTGSSNGDLDDFLDREALESPGDDEDEGEDDEDEDDEEGYNTSDIEAMEDASEEEGDDFDDASSVASSSVAPSTVPDSNLTLDQLIARHTYKPEENMDVHITAATGGRPLVGDEKSGKFSSAKEGTGKLVPSKFVKGAMTREYDEIEAGYGSESSTEEVSLLTARNRIDRLTVCARRTRTR